MMKEKVMCDAIDFHGHCKNSSMKPLGTLVRKFIADLYISIQEIERNLFIIIRLNIARDKIVNDLT